jgi:formylglycine-generating enzyme required for sulfatase activity
MRPKPAPLAVILGWLAPVALLAQGAGTRPPEDPVTRVIVGVVTAVLASILTLIFSEPIKAFLKKIGGWISGFFGRLGWRFPKRYLAALADRHRWLKLIGVYNSADLHPPRLQEVYVSLRVAAAKGEDGPRFAWSEIFQPDQKRLVILGSPGAGKSTLLDYMVLVFTGHLRHTLRDRLGKPFPLFARLRELGTEGADTVPALLAKAVPLEKVPADFPERWLRRGGCLVLLDGLDEVLDAERHDRAVEEIKRLVGEYPDNYYVVTCRIAGWHNQLEGFRTYEVQPFTGDDVRQFISSWYREVLRTQKVNRLGAKPSPDQLKAAESEAYTEAAEQTEALWQALCGRADLLRVAGTPLLLSLITLVHFHRQTDLPKGRAKLYEQCVEILLDLWDRQDKRLRLPEVPTLKEKRMVLEAIAFHYLKEDLLEADMPALRGIVEPLLPRIEAKVNAEGLVRQIWERSGILQEQRLGWFGFAHRALHDFLAAAYVVEHELDDLLLDKAGEERWREVILIAAGLAPAKRAQRLIKILLARQSESAAELEVAGLTLAEDIQLGNDLRAEVRRRLLDRLSLEEAAGPFRRLAGTLVAADLEAAQRWMGEELRGRDPQRLRRVLELLPGLGEAHARPLTAVVLRLIEEDLGVRTRALHALAGLKVLLDAEVLRILKKVRQEREPALKNAAAWAWCELGRPEDLGLVKVPAGEFLMGSVEGDADERPQHTLHLPTFYIGKFPVIVDSFDAFLAESGSQLEDERRYRAFNRQPDHPVLTVSWHDALEYARWHGMGLPSEAEWEKAARGTDGRRYPWGNEWREELANTAESRRTERVRVFSWLRRRPKYGTTTPVGAFSPRGDSPYGCADMAGNVWEWTRSINQPYPYDPSDGREDLQASLGALRVLRGGAFFDVTWFVRCAFRGWSAPGSRNWDVGFRLVLLPFSSDL